MNENKTDYKEIEAKAIPGMPILILNLLLIAISVFAIIGGVGLASDSETKNTGILLIVGGAFYLGLICWFPFMGLKILKPNEAIVLTLFGKYYGTLRGDGFFFVNPFVTAINPTAEVVRLSTGTSSEGQSSGVTIGTFNKKISLKNMTLSNEQQKINDQLGNPIIIGINVIWKVVNTAEAVFAVDNYKEFLSIQCDSALRNIIRLYPYDVPGNDDNEKSLRGSSQEVADRLKAEIQSKVDVAGLEIVEARITHLSYAQEIAAIMLQRQQASAIIDARQMIVEGAVGMVEMALNRFNEKDIIQLDEERKAAMVSNLLVVLCGNRDAQPIVNSGSLY